MELFPLFVFGLFLVYEIIFMIYGVNLIRLARASSSWPTTSGTIIISEIETSRDSDGDRTYSAIVKFSYHVNGQTFTGDKVFLGSGVISSNNYRYVNEIISKYPKQKRVGVFYNPSQPNQSVLEPGINKITFIKITFGNICLTMFTLWFLAGSPSSMFIVRNSFLIFFFIILLNFCVIFWLIAE